jgi:hypothetical protein
LKHSRNEGAILAGSTTKKAIIRRFDRETLSGYLNPSSFLQPSGVEMLTAQGNILEIPYSEVKAVAFVRDFGPTAETGRAVFHTRPKTAGLWVAIEFRDGEAMEGVMPNDLLQLEPFGFTVIPPDPYSNQQRLFIPRVALRKLEVLGVVGSPLKRRKEKIAPQGQIGLFDES